MRNLSDLGIGETAVIESIGITGILKRRIVDMGLTKGSTVKIERVAPLGDPIDIKVKNSHIAIRRSAATNIRIKSAM